MELEGESCAGKQIVTNFAKLYEVPRNRRGFFLTVAAFAVERARIKPVTNSHAFVIQTTSVEFRGFIGTKPDSFPVEISAVNREPLPRRCSARPAVHPSK